jgi:hypothetical protein
MLSKARNSTDRTGARGTDTPAKVIGPPIGAKGNVFSARALDEFGRHLPERAVIVR